VYILHKLAEEKIKDSIARGDFDNLAGAGKPIVLEDESYIPEELRAGIRILKNSGYLPAEIQLRKDIANVEELLLHAGTVAEKEQLVTKIGLLRSQLQMKS